MASLWIFGGLGVTLSTSDFLGFSGNFKSSKGGPQFMPYLQGYLTLVKHY